MNSLKTIRIEENDAENGVLRVVCNDGSRRVLRIQKVLQDEHIPLGMRETWRCMWEAGDFGKADLYGDDIVWDGWCEVLAEDIDDYLEII